MLDNALNVMMAMDWGQRSCQRIVHFQLDLEKAFDKLFWNFLKEALQTMGFVQIFLFS